MNIWQSLPRPFTVLAPLDGVADTVFRRIVAEIARPDLFVSEFTSADGYCSPGRDIVRDKLLFTDVESPIIAQIWGRNPDTIFEITKAIAGMGFVGVDLNTGCPDKTVMKGGAGGALIDTPDVAKAVIQAMKDGVKAAGKTIPVSVKARIGNKAIVTERWLTFLLEQGIDALTVHGRTVAELSKVPAHWDEIGKVVKIRDRMKIPTVIVGNGDVADVKDAIAKHQTYGVDGVMIGRGIFNNMWAFDRSGPHVGTPKELLDIMERHVRLFDEVWKDRKNFPILRKFFKIYVSGFRGATEWRVRCMETNSPEEILAILTELRASGSLELS